MTISTLALSRTSAFSIAENQKKLVQAQTEQSTGRHADIGRFLGFRTSSDINARLAIDRNSSQIDLNGLTSQELQSTQIGLTALVDLAHNFAATLIGARNAQNGQQVVKEAATNALARLQDLLNLSHGGKALFAGTNTGSLPLSDYLAASGATSKATVDASFLAQFGVAQNNAAVANITPQQMEAFLDGGFIAQFDQANWSANWSNASNSNRNIRVDDNMLVQVQANANDPAFRNLTMALTMALDLGTGSLNQSTFEKIVDRSTAVASTAARDIGNMGGVLGLAQKQITTQNELLARRNEVLTLELGGLENVDAFEVATRLNGLTTQLEASYAITVRINKLSLLNYL